MVVKVVRFNVRVAFARRVLSLEPRVVALAARGVMHISPCLIVAPSQAVAVEEYVIGQRRVSETH